MKRGLTLGGLTLALLAVLFTRGFGEPREELRDFMRAKLRHSQKVLEGLVLEDYDTVAKSAQEMSLLSLAETWQVLNTPDYIEYSRKFRNATDSLADAAKRKKLDQATLAFNQVTVKCVECHKYVRGVRMAEASK